MLNQIGKATLFASLASLLATQAFAQAGALPIPLDAADPAKPLILIDDKTWTGSAIQAQSKRFSSLNLANFTYDASKGAVTLVVDYAATRPESGDSEALIEIGIECPEASTPCAIPINKAFMGIRSAFMGETVAILDGKPEAVWAARESHSYVFAPDTLVSVSLSLDDTINLDPKAIRARLIYGNFNTKGLPGQQTRGSLVLKISAAVFALLIFVFWRLRR